MPDRSRKGSQMTALFAAAGILLILLALMVATTVTAQDETTPEPTFDIGFNQPPTRVGAIETPNPQMLPSLTGVNGRAVNAAIVIRSGPGLSFAQIGSVPQGGWIDIVGWNGWTLGRVCSATFQSDLDMWVQVQSGERRGWIARCVLEIRGKVTNLPIVSASGERTLQR